MKIFKNKNKLQEEIVNIKNISFVPTMGGLHKGHISLIKKSKLYKGKILVSIFINPKQFNKKNDFQSYPREIKKDLNILRYMKIDYVYLPNYKDVYSFKPKKEVFLDNFSKKLCGFYRRGHFEGVLDVVNRFLEIIGPKYIFLGIKDFQQMYLIDRHIKKRKIKTKVIDCKTIREENGIACSTRNNNLNRKQLKVASKVYHYLKKKKKLMKLNINNFEYKKFSNDLINLGLDKIDYIKIYNLKTLKKPKHIKENFRIFIAYYLNKIRLIDNI